MVRAVGRTQRAGGDQPAQTKVGPGNAPMRRYWPSVHIPSTSFTSAGYRPPRLVHSDFWSFAGISCPPVSICERSKHPRPSMVRKGSSVRVRQRAPSDLQGKRSSLRGAIRDLAQPGRNSRPRSVHFVTPRARVAEANPTALWAIPQVPPVGDPFSLSARSTPSSVSQLGGPGKRWTPAVVAPLAGGRVRSLDVTAARRGQRAEGRPRGPP